jgi:hypothetical protein
MLSHTGTRIGILSENNSSLVRSAFKGQAIKMEGEQVHNMIHRIVSEKGFLIAHALPLCTGT